MVNRNEFEISSFQTSEVLGGKPSTKKFIRLSYKGKPIGQISYEMTGKSMKIWNRVTYGSPQERREINQLFSSQAFNKDKRSVGEELLLQAIKKEKPLGIKTPHKTSSAKNAEKRLMQKFGIKIGYIRETPAPKKITTVLNRNRRR